ncbi:MAG: flavin reductase family protein [Promethearchaeota archaeon]
MSKDLVLAAKDKDKVNIMALAWKSLGNLWGYNVWVVAVKPSRYTYEMLNNNPEFTLHLFPPDLDNVISVAGTASGRYMDKIKETGITPIPSKTISVPIFEEAAISYECKIIHTAESGKITDHRLYFGHIQVAYADRDLVAKYYD